MNNKNSHYFLLLFEYKFQIDLEKRNEIEQIN